MLFHTSPRVRWMFASFLLVGLFLLLEGNAAFAQPTSVPPSENVNAEFMTLQVDEDTTLSGNLSVGKAVSVSGNLGVLSALTVDGDATIKGGLTIKGDLTVEGKINGSSSSATGGSGSSKQYEAEKAKVSGATVVLTTSQGNSGSGYVDYQNTTGDYIEWTVQSTTASNYQLNFRYAYTSGTPSLEIKVNNVAIKNLDFPSTGTITTWKTVGLTASLISGTNKVRATTIGSAGPNVDHLSVGPEGSGGTSSTGYVQGDLTVTGQIFGKGLSNLEKGAVIKDSLTVNAPASFSQPVSINTPGTTAALTAVLQSVEVSKHGIFGGVQTSDDPTVYGAYLGYRASDGMYDVYATGISKMNDLIVDNQLLTENIASPTGILNMQGGVTIQGGVAAQSFGRFKVYSEAAVSGGATYMNALCANATEIMISCGGLSSTDNFKGSLITGAGTSSDPFRCTSYRSTTSGTLYSIAYCFDPTVLQ